MGYSVDIQKIISSKNAVSMASGEKLYNLIIEHFNSNTSEEIVLDFGGIDVFATPFFNASIGYLFKDYSRKAIAEKLKIINISDTGKNLLHRVIENAIEYYKDPNRINKIADELINRE